jgi:hypothetical protein
MKIAIALFMMLAATAQAHAEDLVLYGAGSLREP